MYKVDCRTCHFSNAFIIDFCFLYLILRLSLFNVCRRIEKQNTILVERTTRLLAVLSKNDAGPSTIKDNFYKPLKGFPLNTIDRFKDLDCDNPDSLKLREQLVSIL